MAGQIFLYGETHGSEPILKQELELWKKFYSGNDCNNDPPHGNTHHEGLRHLFLELPYYAAEFLNLWMRSDRDDILEALFQDWKGTQTHVEAEKSST